MTDDVKLPWKSIGVPRQDITSINGQPVYGVEDHYKLVPIHQAEALWNGANKLVALLRCLNEEAKYESISSLDHIVMNGSATVEFLSALELLSQGIGEEK